MDRITYCIPSKDNLRYLKTAIPSIRKNAYRKDHNIIIFVDSDEDGTVEWLEEVKEDYKIKYILNPNLGKQLYGIGKAYDECIRQSDTEVVMVFHADMMLGKNADLKAYNHLKPKTVVSSTRVEPPLHPNEGEKIIRDFGIWPEEFKEDLFDNFVNQELDSDKITNGIFAPWMVFKKDFLEIGGHDTILKSCREDSDIFNRMKLAGFTFIQPWNSLVYHLTGRGAGSFSGDEQRHKDWQQEMQNSTKEFIRKWGSNVLHTKLMEPIILPKYNIGIKIKGGTSNLLELLEPWCSHILLDDEMQVITTHYIDKEQKNTASDLSKRIKSTPFQSLDNDIIVEIDQSTFNNEDFKIIQQLSQIIKDSGEVGKFKIGNLFITIDKLGEHQNNLIKI